MAAWHLQGFCFPCFSLYCITVLLMFLLFPFPLCFSVKKVQGKTREKERKEKEAIQ